MTWERLEEVFEQACALPAEARAGFLDRACAGEVALRTEVEAMLAVADGTGLSRSSDSSVEEPASEPMTISGWANASDPGG